MMQKWKHCWRKFWPLYKEYCRTMRKVWVNTFISRAGQAAGVLVIYISPFFTSSELGTSSLWAARWDKRMVWWRQVGHKKGPVSVNQWHLFELFWLQLTQNVERKTTKTRQSRLLPVQWFVECVGIYKPLNRRQNKKTSCFLVIGN